MERCCLSEHREGSTRVLQAGVPLAPDQRGEFEAARTSDSSAGTGHVGLLRRLLITWRTGWGAGHRLGVIDDRR